MGTTSKSRSKYILLLILAVSAAIHVAYLGQLAQTPFTRSLVLDAKVYHEKAIKILDEGWLGTSAFYQAPLYPYVVAVTYRVVGRHIPAVLWLQALASVSSVLLVFLLGRSLFDDRTGLLGAAIAALYGCFVFYSGLLLKASLSVFFTCAFLLALMWTCDRPTPGRFYISGLLLGVGITLRGNFLLVLAVFVVWIAFFAPGASRAKAALLFLLGGATIVAPITLRNYVVADDFVLVNYDAGPNFFIGNNPEAGGGYSGFGFVRPHPRFEERDYTARAEQKTGRTLKPSEISRYWLATGLTFPRDEPRAWLSLLATKCLLFVNNHEKADNYNLYFMRTLTPALRVAFVPFGVLLILAVIGMVTRKGEGPAFWIVYLFVATYALSVVAFFVNSRYRLPIVPALIPFAAHALLEGWRPVVRLRGVRLAATLLGVGLLAWCVFRPLPPNDLSLALYNYGAAFEELGDLDQAAVQFEKALAVEPVYPFAALALARIHDARGAWDDAIVYYSKALEAQPRSAEIHVLLGLAHRNIENLNEAVRHYELALAIEPDNVAALTNLGSAQISQGRFEAAVAALREAIRIRPDLADAHFNLAIAYARLGLGEEAEREHRLAIELRGLPPAEPR